MSPAPQCTKNLRGAAFYFTIPQSAGTNSDQRIYSKPDKRCSPVPCKEIRLFTRYPWKTARKTIPMSTRNFPPRHQVSSGAQNMPSVLKQRTCQLKRKFATIKEVEPGLKCTGGQLPDTKCHKIHQYVSPWWKERLRVSFSSSADGPRTVSQTLCQVY